MTSILSSVLSFDFAVEWLPNGIKYYYCALEPLILDPGMHDYSRGSLLPDLDVVCTLIQNLKILIYSRS